MQEWLITAPWISPKTSGYKVKSCSFSRLSHLSSQWHRAVAGRACHWFNLIFAGRIKNIVLAPVWMLLLNFDMSVVFFHFLSASAGLDGKSDSLAAFASSSLACTFSSSSEKLLRAKQTNNPKKPKSKNQEPYRGYKKSSWSKCHDKQSLK